VSRKARVASQAGIVLMIVAATLFAAASGIFVRDFGAGFRSNANGPIDVGGAFEDRINMYQLTYEVAVFSTVEVQVTILSVYGTQRFEARSNGSLLTTFRPELPGLHHIVILNVASVPGQIGYSILLSSDVPPELETAMLDPLLYASASLLVVSVALSVVSRVLPRVSKEEDAT